MYLPGAIDNLEPVYWLIVQILRRECATNMEREIRIREVIQSETRLPGLAMHPARYSKTL